MKFSLDLQWPNLPTEDQIHRFFINEKKMYLKIFRLTLRFVRKSYRNVEFSRIFDLRKSYRRGSPRIHGYFMVTFTCGWYHEIIIQQNNHRVRLTLAHSNFPLFGCLTWHVIESVIRSTPVGFKSLCLTLRTSHHETHLAYDLRSRCSLPSIVSPRFSCLCGFMIQHEASVCIFT